MNDEQTALVRIQENELALTERKINEQIARAEKSARSARKFLLGGSSIMATSVISTTVATLTGLVLAPHLVLGFYVVGALGMIGGSIKTMISDERVSTGRRHREEIVWRRQSVEQKRLWRLENAAIAVLRERGLDALAVGQEIRLDFEDEAPKLLCVTEVKTVYTPPEDGHPYQHQRICFALYEAKPSRPYGDLTRTGAALCVSYWDFGMPEPSPQPAEPEKILPFTARAYEPVFSLPRQDARPEPEKKLPPCGPVRGG